jgi:hypothetical protein
MTCLNKLINNNEHKKLLDLNDQIYLKLKSSGYKNADDILEDLPILIMVGAQSSGKSSITNKFCGRDILPTDSGVCTRVACIVKLRKKNDVFNKVVLINTKNKNEKTYDNKKTKLSITEAQKDAIKDYDENVSFAYEHYIEISIYGPDKPNITFIDLPGFTTNTSDEKNTVESIVKPYIKRRGALILQIIKGDQDYGSILGNDFIKDNIDEEEYSKKVITIMTNCDKKEGCMENLNKTIEKIENNIFAVIGNILDDKEEEKKINTFKYLKDYPDKINLGTTQLLEYIEKMMIEHLNEKLPKVYKSLCEHKSKIQNEISKIPEVNMDILNTGLNEIEKAWDSKIKKYENNLLKTIENFTESIININIELIECIEDKECNNLDINTDIIQKGKILYYELPDYSNYVKVKITNIYEKEEEKQLRNEKSIIKNLYCNCIIIDKDYINYKKNNNNDELKLLYEDVNLNLSNILVKNLFSLEPQRSSIYEDIKILLSKRGFRNKFNADPQYIINIYGKQFIKNCLEKIYITEKEIKNDIINMINDAFKSSKIETLKKTIKKMEGEMISSFNNTVRKKLLERINEIEIYYTKLDNYTTNTHYRNQTFLKLIQNENDMTDDYAEERIIEYNIRSYLKTQKKFLIELFAKEIQRLYLYELDNLFKKKIINSSREKILKYIDEPEKIKHIRKGLENNVKNIDDIISIIDSKKNNDNNMEDDDYEQIGKEINFEYN